MVQELLQFKAYAERVAENCTEKYQVLAQSLDKVLLGLQQAIESSDAINIQFVEAKSALEQLKKTYRQKQDTAKNLSIYSLQSNLLSNNLNLVYNHVSLIKKELSHCNSQAIELIKATLAKTEQFYSLSFQPESYQNQLRELKALVATLLRESQLKDQKISTLQEQGQRIKGMESRLKYLELQRETLQKRVFLQQQIFRNSLIELKQEISQKKCALEILETKYAAAHREVQAATKAKSQKEDELIAIRRQISELEHHRTNAQLEISNAAKQVKGMGLVKPVAFKKLQAILGAGREVLQVLIQEKRQNQGSYSEEDLEQLRFEAQYLEEIKPIFEKWAVLKHIKQAQALGLAAFIPVMQQSFELVGFLTVQLLKKLLELRETKHQHGAMREAFEVRLEVELRASAELRQELARQLREQDRSKTEEQSVQAATRSNLFALCEQYRRVLSKQLGGRASDFLLI